MNIPVVRRQMIVLPSTPSIVAFAVIHAKVEYFNSKRGPSNQSQTTRGGILDRKTKKPQKPTDNLQQRNHNRGKPNRICCMKNRTAFAVAVTIALVLKQHNGVLQIHSPPPTLEFVVNA
ncbi:unnamed protein product [Prunus armeniaca]